MEAAASGQRSVELSLSRGESSLARRTAADAGDRLLLSSQSEGDEGGAMFNRSAKSAPKLETRTSDAFETADSSGAVEWEREPILNLVTAVLGNCVLGFPFCFKTCGLGLAVLLVLVTLAAAELSMRLLLMASQLTGKRSYEELARHCFGWGGEWAVNASIVAMNVGSVVSYLLILTDTISSVAGTVIPPGAEPSRNIMLGLMTLVCLPVCLYVKSPRLQAGVNTLAMTFLLFFCGIITMLPFSPTPNSGALDLWKWEGVLVAFPIVSYGFTAHQYLFRIYPASQRPTMRKMTTAVQRGMVLSAVIYVAVGAGGYSAFGARTAGDVLRNLGGGAGVAGVRLHAERVLKYGFGGTLLLNIPLTLYPLHDTFAPWLALCSPTYTAAAKHAEAAGLGAAAVVLSQLQESVLTTGILGASYALAVLLPNVEFVFGLAGSTASTLMAFILPAAIFLHVSAGQRGMLGHSVDMLRGSDVWRQRRRMASALLLFGCVAGVLCTHALVVSIQEEAEVVQLAQELVREEAKVAVATHTEAKAKQVAEVVDAVARAKQEVEVVSAEASGQAQTLARAAEALDTSVQGDWRDRQQQKGIATSDLEQVHTQVDEAVAKLENVTASLTAGASRIRNETAAAKAAAATDPAAAAVGAALTAQQHKDQATAAAAAAGEQQQQQQGQQGKQPQQQPPPQQQLEAQLQQQHVADATALAARAAGARSHGAHGGSSAHEGVVRAAEAAVNLVNTAVRGEAVPAADGDEEAAQALEAMAGAANDTLAAVKQTKAALEAATAEAAITGRTRPQIREFSKAINQAINATAEVAARLNATAAALDAVAASKTSELLNLAAQLAEEGDEEEAEEEGRAAYAQHTAGRKEGLGGGGGGGSGGGSAAAAGMDASAASNATGNATAIKSARKEVRDTLKQAVTAGSSGNVSAVNVSAVAAAAMQQAATVVASSREKMGETIERKKPKVTERAIEIAKELVQEKEAAGSRGDAAAAAAAAGGNGTAAAAASTVPKVSLISEYAEKHEQRANNTRLAAEAVITAAAADKAATVAAADKAAAAAAAEEAIGGRRRAAAR